MPKYFPGITHAIVKTPNNLENMNRLGSVIAKVCLCFQTDEDYIVLLIKKMEGPTSGAVAQLPKQLAILSDNKLVHDQAVRGKPADELKTLALIAFDKVKQKFGLKFNKQYKVIATDITELGATNAERSPRVGERTAS